MNNFEKLCCLLLGSVVLYHVSSYELEKIRREKEEEEKEQLRFMREMNLTFLDILQDSSNVEEAVNKLNKRKRYKIEITGFDGEVVVKDSNIFESFEEALDYEKQLTEMYKPGKYEIEIKTIYVDEAE